MTKILMIDDDESLTDSLATFFQQYGIRLVYTNEPRKGLDLMVSALPELLLLDVMMPDIDGFTLCKQIRENHSLPIIMLTARGGLEDKIHGFELGVDDYLPKPFEPLELLARVQALLRRSNNKKIDGSELEEVISYSGLNIYPKQQRVEIEGQEISLSGMEFQLLYTLSKNPGKVFNREQIVGALKGIEVDLFGRSVDILLSRLRQKLNDSASSPRFIKTIRGIGYTFVATPL